MGAKYTEAQKRAIKKYQKKFIKTALPLTESEHERFYRLAEEKNISLKKLIVSLLEEEYSRTFPEEYINATDCGTETESVEAFELSDEQKEALDYARRLFDEFVSYPDFLWDWNWKSEGILNSFDTEEKEGAINRNLRNAGLSTIKGLIIDPESFERRDSKLDEDTLRKQHDEYLEKVLKIKEKILIYFRNIDKATGSGYSQI